jgi:hypothetical protein
MIEICVCAVCPFPGSGTIAWPYISADERRMTLVSVPLDVLLSVPMFLRAYLLCRFMVLHSRQFQASSAKATLLFDSSQNIVICRMRLLAPSPVSSPIATSSTQTAINLSHSQQRSTGSPWISALSSKP